MIKVKRNKGVVFWSQIGVFIVFLLGCSSKEVKNNTIHNNRYERCDFTSHILLIKKAIKDKDMKMFNLQSKWFLCSRNPEILFGYAYQMSLRCPDDQNVYGFLFRSMGNFSVDEKDSSRTLNQACFFLSKSYELSNFRPFEVEFNGVTITDSTIKEPIYYLSSTLREDNRASCPSREKGDTVIKE